MTEEDEPLDQAIKKIQDNIDQTEALREQRRAQLKQSLEANMTSVFAQDREEQKDFRKLLLKMTPFEQRFVEAYVKVPSTVEAARVAGSTSKHPERVGYQTMLRSHVQAAIALGLKLRINALALDNTEVIQKLREVFSKAMEEGNFVAANRSAELLGQALGMFKPQGLNKPGITVMNNLQSNLSTTENTLEISTKEDTKELDEDITRLSGIIASTKTRI